MKEPGDIPVKFVEAWNARQADLIAALFEDDADFINVVGIWWQNKADIFKAHDYGLKVIFNESTLHIGKIKVKMLNEESAVIHARMRLVGQSPNNGLAGQRNNMFIFVVRKHGDHWRCVSAQNTDIVPGPETHLLTEENELITVNYQNIS